VKQSPLGYNVRTVPKASARQNAPGLALPARFGRDALLRPAATALGQDESAPRDRLALVHMRSTEDV
jgi:hypothetical protein